MTQVRSVPVLQTSKVLGILYFLLGAVFSCVGLIVVMIRSTESPVVTLMALMALPILAGLLGFAATAIGCSLYNQLAAWMGGISLDLVGDAVGQPTAAQGDDRNQDASRSEPADDGRRGKGRSQVKSISIFRVKPNPEGKARRRSGSPLAAEVGGEWVDIRNHGMNTVTTKGVCLYHLAYPSPGGAAEGRLVVSLPDRWLKPGEILRMHSGQRRDLSVLHPEDRTGADWHSFTGEDVFNYNNREGDTLVLYEVATEETLDSASYESNPPEGAVLLRQGAKLGTAKVAAGSF